MVYTRDSQLWREEGPKALLEFLSTAEGEQHDAAVYDTKCEFDRQDPDAIRYIACVAMTKASGDKEEYTYELPSNGTVAPIGAPIGTGEMLRSAAFRAEKEKAGAADNTKMYIPNAGDYISFVIDALKHQNIPLEDMTEEERAANRSDGGGSIVSGYLSAIGVKGVLFVVFFFIGLVGLLKACFG